MTSSTSSSLPSEPSRFQLSIGARPVGGNSTSFRVWAPGRQKVAVEIQRSPRETEIHPLIREERGYFAAIVPHVVAGNRYQFRLDDHLRRPDPASRFQPDGPHGWSLVVDPTDHRWHDTAWRGRPKSELVIYELHVGTFTAEGTYRAAGNRLEELRDLGVTAIELMPVAQSPGRWNWGYDGVNLFAPRQTYGTPGDLRALVDLCHKWEISVLLDVVYNHLGPEGNYLGDFAPYFSKRHGTPWGPAFNFDGRHSAPVRDYILQNVLYWLHEFHIDGLRLDALHFMYDDSSLHIVDEISQRVEQSRQKLGRTIHLIGETNVFDAARLAPHPVTAASYDAIWCDDFLHAVQSVALQTRKLTNRVYHGRDDLVSVLEHGYLYASPGYTRVTRPMDHPVGPTESLVFSLQNHDVIGNHPDGDRLHHLASPEFQRTAAALMLLYPAIPMIFMGEEYSADAKFLFFVDFGDESLRQAVVRGRAAEHPQHAWQNSVSPISEEAFVLSRPGSKAAGDNMTWNWYRDLLAVRHQWIADGTLHARHVRVRSDAQSQLVILQYETAANNRFVAVRLHDRQHVPVPLQLRIDGRILLASDGLTTPPLAAADPLPVTIPLPLNRAIVGEGSVEWVIAGELAK